MTTELSSYDRHAISSTASSEEANDPLVRLVSRRHPLYEAMSKHWMFMDDTYSGGREWFNHHIFKYIIEGDAEFKDRISRAYRFNHTREVVDLINKYLFKQEITRNKVDAPADVVKFWKNCTKSGLTINDFVRQISKKTSIYGRIGVVIDMDAVPEDQRPLNKREEKEAGLSAYAYIITPLQMLDYSFDDHGKLNWMLIHEVVRDDEDPLNSTGKAIHRFRLWTKTEWKLFEKQNDDQNGKITIKEIDRGSNTIGEVPIILADNIISDEEYSAPSLIDDIAYLDRAVANYLSNLDAIIQDQTFSQLAMPVQGMLPGDESEKKLIEMGTKRLFTYDGSDGAKPYYLSPDVKQADLIIQVVTKIINEIYHTVGLAGERTKQDNAVGIDNSSGVAKAYDFERVNALLAAKADSLEAIENKIVDLVCKRHGVKLKEDSTPLVSYPDNFDTRGLYDEFDIAARLMLIDAPETIRRHQMESIVEKLFPQLSKALKDEMLRDLKNWPTDPLEELTNRTTDTTGEGNLKRNITRSSSGTPTKPSSNSSTKANKKTRQGQVTESTS
ncbi:hypothetical protein BFR73_02635 [Acinetobacter pittii]|uniref:phage portal protein n=1 Tax=Acinetobacter pittii TaxID=48296 RepID=UPI0008398B8F|nr:phage portal protein [Acinetobacter pittii]OCZ48850.1 hypothetical protein BFR73_02635 [Acinetobacter pittii]